MRIAPTPTNSLRPVASRMVYIGPHSLPPSTGHQIQQESLGRGSSSPEHHSPARLRSSGPPCLSWELLSCHPIGNVKSVGTCAPLVLTSGATSPRPVYDNEVLTTECPKALLLVLKFKAISGHSSIENDVNAHVSTSPWYLDTHLKS